MLVVQLSSSFDAYNFILSEDDDMVFTIISLDGKSWDFEAATTDVCSVVCNSICFYITIKSLTLQLESKA